MFVRLNDHKPLENIIASFDIAPINKLKALLGKSAECSSELDKIEFYTGYIKIVCTYQASGWILYSVSSKSGYVRRTGVFKKDISPIEKSIKLLKKAVKARNIRIKSAKIPKIRDSVMRLVATELCKNNINFTIESGMSTTTFKIHCGLGYGKSFYLSNGAYYMDGYRFKYSLGDPEHNIVRSIVDVCKIVKKLKKVTDEGWSC